MLKQENNFETNDAALEKGSDNVVSELVTELPSLTDEQVGVEEEPVYVDIASSSSNTSDDVDFSLYGVDVNDRKKKKTRDRPPLRKLFNPKNLQTEVNKYGYSFSINTFYLSILVALAATIGVGLLFKLQIVYILLIFIVCLLCLPSLVFTIYKNMYESKRFHDVSNYMEQLLYSFRKKKKILTSLEDVLVAFEEDKGPMAGLIEKAIEHIRTSESDGDIYREALDIIEKEYDNTRLRNVHNFLIAVENHGGKVEAPVDLLLDDHAMWDERVHAFQKERDTVRRNIIVSICFSLALCFFILYILGTNELEKLAISQNIVVQCSSTFVILASVLLATKVVNKLSQSWIKRENKSSDYQILSDYFAVVKRDKKKELKSQLIWTGATLPILILGLILGNTLVTILGALISGFCFLSPIVSQSLCRKSTLKEIEKAFPQWLMELALILQGNNVQVGIAKTMDSAPVVLRPELHKLVEGFERDTTSITPYNNFFADFDLPEIKSAMRMLYSITTTGTGDVDEQITDLIKKQNVLMDKAEKISNEETLVGLSTLTMVPMLFCIFKSLVDMTILVFSLFTLIQF